MQRLMRGGMNNQLSVQKSAGLIYMLNIWKMIVDYYKQPCYYK